MTASGAQGSDLAMKGGGYYSLSTKDVIDAVTPMVLRAIEAMRPDAGTTPFTLADMGCADGGTSLSMVRAAIAALRAAAPQRPVAVVYTDQPRNDYNALFRLVQGAGENDPSRPEWDGVHVFASATSFYRQILPPETLDLGFSATAMHWLSRKPCDISTHVHAVGARASERAAFAEQGRRDWQTILLRRAAELKSGGRLVFANFCVDQAGRYLGHTGGVDMFDSFDAIWRGLLEDGTISRDEYSAMTLPQYYKTVAEFRGPLDDPGDPVHRAGLRLEQIETRVTPCPYAAEFRRHGDAAAFARSYIPTLRSWTESTFHQALLPDRPAEQRSSIIKLFYDTYEARVRDNPEGHAMDYVHAFMTIAKL